MSGNTAVQQNLAQTLSDVLGNYVSEGGSKERLAKQVKEDWRDLMRWAGGTTLPGHVLILLLRHLPRHLANDLIEMTDLELQNRDRSPSAGVLKAVAAASSFTADVAERYSDGDWCHRDQAEAEKRAKQTITELQNFVGD